MTLDARHGAAYLFIYGHYLKYIYECIPLITAEGRHLIR